MSSASSMHEAWHSKQVLLDNPEGWGREGRGRGVQDGGHMCTCGPFMSMYGKKHHNIIKQFSNLNKLIFLKKKLSSSYNFSCYIYSLVVEYQESCH